MLSKEFSRKLEEKQIPIFSSIEITSRCNLRCKFCYLDHSDNDELSTDEIKNYLEQLAGVGSLFLSLTGGEPLLRKDFWKIAQHAHNLGFAINLKTNGTLIDEKAASQIAALSFYRVDISLLGATPDVHDGITQAQGSLEKTLQAVKMLREKDIKVFLMSTIIRENHSEFMKIKELADRMDAPLASTPLVYPKNDSGKEPLRYRLTDKELTHYFRETLDPHSVNVLCPDTDSDPLICQAGRTDISINNQGKVYPCLAFPWEVGDLRKRNLEEILKNSKRLSLFRSLDGSEFKDCLRCKDNSLCMRCPGLAYSEKGDLFGVSPEHCRQTKIIKEVLQ
jgi:radical SAM protein with 4Fe4S-binding SPASM domain